MGSDEINARFLDVELCTKSIDRIGEHVAELDVDL